MKQMKLLCSTIILLCFFQQIYSQTINFNNLKKVDRHIATIHTGLDYGLVLGAGYGYQLKSRMPIVLNSEISVPFGEKRFDDFKSKLGGQIRLFKINKFHFSAKAQAIFRQNENDFVRLQNFGAEVSGTVGFYKRRWFAALEAGFDKAIVTHLKHTNMYKQMYPAVKDGWYEPATGGNYNYGFLGGYSFKNSDLFFKAGLLATQNFEKPQFPFYAQLGYTIKL